MLINIAKTMHHDLDMVQVWGGFKQCFIRTGLLERTCLDDACCAVYCGQCLQNLVLKVVVNLVKVTQTKQVLEMYLLQ